MAQKYSRQREIIRNFMRDRTDHPTADVVYMNVRKEIPNISLGTVYRNLMLLAQTGELAKVEVGDGTVHFDPLTDEHGHFICEDCGTVSDLFFDCDDALTKKAEQEMPGAKINSRTITFRGLCPACAKKMQTAGTVLTV